MTDQSIGPRCGNNPTFRMSDGDRKAVEDFKGRLALQAAAKPYIDRAVWTDGDPLMEVIAATIWKRCARDSEDMPQLVCDDPRTIAAFAAAVARAHADVALPPAADRAAVERVRAVLETEAVVGRSALEYRGLIVSALMGAEAQQQPEPESEGCAHCGKTIRCITGTLTRWWVHEPGGHTVCFPEHAAASTRATPKPAVPVGSAAADTSEETRP